MIPEQKDMWNKKHAEGHHDWFSDTPSKLATIVATILPKNAKLLEIGCGNGRDARYFASMGLQVVATDFSGVAIEKNKQNNNKDNLNFSVLDIRDSFTFDNQSFDAVFSSLALHYYSDEQTKRIFREIHRVLKPNAVFAFSCKEYDEVRMKDATIIEQNVYLDKNGHVLHSFSEEYARQLCEGLFEIALVESKDEEYGGRVSTIVSCVVRKQ